MGDSNVWQCSCFLEIIISNKVLSQTDWIPFCLDNTFWRVVISFVSLGGLLMHYFFNRTFFEHPVLVTDKYSVEINANQLRRVPQRRLILISAINWKSISMAILKGTHARRPNTTKTSQKEEQSRTTRIVYSQAGLLIVEVVFLLCCEKAIVFYEWVSRSNLRIFYSHAHTIDKKIPSSLSLLTIDLSCVSCSWHFESHNTTQDTCHDLCKIVVNFILLLTVCKRQRIHKNDFDRK